MTRGWLALAAAGLLSACGGSLHRPTKAAEPATAASPGAEPALTLTDEEIERVVSHVSTARQLPPTRTVSVVRLAKDRFVERLLRRDDDDGEPRRGLSPEAAFLVGFNFIPEPSKRGGIPTFDEVLKEQVVGFYDLEADKIFIPDVAAPSEQKLLEQRAVLAHEVQHALQAQRFPRLRVPANSDEAIAQKSLLEGDAMVAMGALLGAEAGAPVGRTLRRLVEVTKRVPLATVTGAEGARKLDQALELTRKRLVFPYEEGMLFVADVYRAGGFPLVDRIYAEPPRSTAQILHPEKYLAGIAPRPIADPEPSGYKAASVDTLGELNTRILLGRCLDTDLAARAAAGWAGDRFGVFTGPNRELSVGWISAWDTEDEAREMEAALEQSAGCWQGNAVGLDRDDFAIDASFKVSRQGKLIAFVRGFSEREAPRVTQHLLSLVGPEQAPKPLTSLQIPPRATLPEPRPGRIRGDIYQNDWLGVVGRVPPGMAGKVGKDEVDFTVERADANTFGTLNVTTRVATSEQNDKTFREVEDNFVSGARKYNGQVLAYPERSVKTTLGAGTERTWGIRGSTTQLRAVLIPICAGTGSIAFVQIYNDAYARKVLDGWMDSFRWAHGRNVLACDYLDPK